VQHALDTGRSYHRQWIGKAFATELAALEPPHRDQLSDELYVLTDLLVWKLLRCDLGLSAEDTVARIRRLVTSALESSRAAVAAA
jgi:hypothetical protein